MPSRCWNACIVTMHDAFTYDPVTGKIYWKPGQRKAGKEAGCLNADGYVVIGYKGKRIYGHHLAWFLVHDVWPNFIDHDNRVRNDNRISNLNPVPKQVNHKNMKRFSNNISGVTGVSRHNQTGKWRAVIKVNNKQIALGCFTEFSDAVQARQQAETRYGFHPNHGT